MYSVVLLMAITAGGESADACRGCRGCGCYSRGCGCRHYCGGGCYSYGCYSGGCYGGCYGGHSYGCYTGGYRPVVSHGCYGGGAVYHGCSVAYSAPVVHHGCTVVHHGGTVVHHGCTVVYPSCVSGHVVPNGADKKAEKKKDNNPEAKEEVRANGNKATIVVALPSSAKVTIDGQATAASAAATRYFESPELTNGKTYAYTFVAEYEVDGQPMRVSKEVRFQAGKVVNLDLTTGGTRVARR